LTFIHNSVFSFLANVKGAIIFNILDRKLKFSIFWENVQFSLDTDPDWQALDTDPDPAK
jgi:hypothetical protein